jgi:DNA-binding MarR family transcriptional regulator
MPMFTASTLSRSIKRLEQLGLIDVSEGKRFPFGNRVRVNWNAIATALGET